MSVKMKFGSKDIPFVYKGDKLVYPNPVKDGLLLWYDFKGMRNTDTNKEVAKDLSGNGNDGSLTNFNFTEESGYKDNTLVFDGVDDSLTIPELELDETAMSVVQGGKIYSYEDDKVLAIKDYSDKELTYLESLRAKGRNLIRGSEFKEQTSYYTYQNINAELSGGVLIATNKITTSYPRIFYRPLGDLIVGEEYTISFKARGNTDFTASFWVSDANGGKSQLTSQNVSYTKEWKSYVFTFTANENLSDSTAIQWWVNKTNPDTVQTLYLKEIKLEKGTIATDWIPAPEDVREKLPGLEAGGRNLIRNSNVASEWGGGTKSGKIGGYDAIHINKTSGEGSWANISSSNFNADRQSDELLTLSGWFYIDGDVEISTLARTIVRFDIPDKTSYMDRLVIRLNQLERDKWVYAHTTQNVSGDFTQIRHIGFSIPEGSVYFRDLKLEKGNVPTTWTPAPEDFQTTSLSPSSLSNLQIYNRPLRKDEILHNAESKGLKELVDGVVVQDGLILHYDFSHESNTSEYKEKAFDYSGNGNHGELQNFNFTEESGYVEDGLKFDGVDDEIDTQTSNYQTAQSTYEVVLDFNGVVDGQAYQSIFQRHSIWIDGLFFSGVQIRSYLNLSGGGKNTMVSVPRGKLFHLTRVVDLENKTETIYINGSSVRHRTDLEGTFDERGNETLKIGRSYSLNSEVCSVRVYNRPLSVEEVAHNYQIEKEKYNIVEGDA